MENERFTIQELIEQLKSKCKNVDVGTLEKLEKLDLLQQSKRGRAFVFIASNDLEQRIKAYQ